MNTSLTTFDGFPRDDIDIAQGALSVRQGQWNTPTEYTERRWQFEQHAYESSIYETITRMS